MRYVAKMVCRLVYVEKEVRIFLSVFGGLLTTREEFRQDFFRLMVRSAKLKLFVPRTDSALILFNLKCHFFLKGLIQIIKKNQEQLIKRRKMVCSEMFHSREHITNIILTDKKGINFSFQTD